MAKTTTQEEDAGQGAQPKAKPAKPRAPRRERARRPPATAQREAKLERVRMPPPRRRPSAARRDGARSEEIERGQVRLLHHQDAAAAAFGPLGIGAEPAEVHTVTLPRHRGGGLQHADGGAGSDARERARAPARQRDGDAAAHGHPDVVRHGLQDRRRHHRAAAVRLRRLHATCWSRCRTSSSSA